MPERTNRSKRPAKKTRSSRSKKVNVAESPVVIPDVSDVVLEDAPSSSKGASAVAEELKTEEVLNLVAPPTTTRRTKASRESVLSAFDALFDSIQEEIELSKTEKKRVVPLRTFKNLQKVVKSLRTDVTRLVKGKRKSSGSNTNGGFMKPVRISKSMAKFTGWDASQLYSRVDVTRFICAYVKEHNLQNPEDKRQWVPDKKLCKLLAYDASTEPPMTYCYLQKKMQPHFQSVKTDV